MPADAPVRIYRLTLRLCVGLDIRKQLRIFPFLIDEITSIYCWNLLSNAWNQARYRFSSLLRQ